MLVSTVRTLGGIWSPLPQITQGPSVSEARDPSVVFLGKLPLMWRLEGKPPAPAPPAAQPGAYPGGGVSKPGLSGPSGAPAAPGTRGDVEGCHWGRAGTLETGLYPLSFHRRNCGLQRAKGLPGSHCEPGHQTQSQCSPQHGTHMPLALRGPSLCWAPDL